MHGREVKDLNINLLYCLSFMMDNRIKERGYGETTLD